MGINGLLYLRGVKYRPGMFKDLVMFSTTYLIKLKHLYSQAEYLTTITHTFRALNKTGEKIV